MIRAGMLALLLLAASPLFAQNTLDIPDKIAVGKKIIARCQCVVPEDGKLSILWDTSERLESEQVENNLHVWGPVGRHSVDAVVIPIRTITIGDQTFDTIAGQIIRLGARVQITGSGPDPDNDDDDGDGVPNDLDKCPNTPKGTKVYPIGHERAGCPVVQDVPFPVPGLVVLTLREPGQVLPAEQQSIFSDSDVRKWLRQYPHKQDGTTLARVWSPGYTDQQLADVPAALRDAYKWSVVNAESYPWIVINDGKQWTSQNLPGTVDDMLALLKMYE